MIPIPFVGASYTMDALDISSQACKNMYLEVYDDGNTKVPKSLRSSPGLDLFASQTGGAFPVNDDWKMRSLYTASSGDFFAVCGSTVSTFTGSGVESGKFSLNSGATPDDQGIVRCADSLSSDQSTTNVLFVDGSNTPKYYDTTAGTATEVTDTGYPDGATHVANIDGFFIVNKPNTVQCVYSAVNDPSSWNTTNTLAKEGSSDHVTALIANNRRLWVFGSQSYEVFRNTGNSNNQFLRIEGTYHDFGIEAPDSLAEDGDNIYWLGSNKSGFGKIYQSRGFDAFPISTVPLEREIQEYTTTSDAEGFCYQQDGHKFYQLTFPSENKTWVYDSTTGAWHEKYYLNPTTSVEERHRARVSAFFNGNNYVGDWQNNNIYSFEQTTYTDNGDTIIRERIGPVVWNNLDRVYYNSIEFDLESGVGAATGQGSSPLLQLRWSNDGGHKWSNWYYMDMGAIGKYSTRVRRERLGQSRKRVFHIRYSEPTKFTVLSCEADIG
jgi:hypothetical protein